MEAKINKVAEMIAASKKLVVFTGAGISTESGIPDFAVRMDSGPKSIPMILQLTDFLARVKRGKKSGIALLKAD